MEQLRAALTQLMGTRRKVRTVARDTGLSASTVSDIRSGKRGVSRNALQAVVDAYAKEDESVWIGAWERIVRATRPLSEEVATGTPVPRELPPEVSGFTGRDAELAALDRLLRDTVSTRLIAIVGTAGVGKTALAVRWAHLREEQFLDGCLYIDLRGYDPLHPLTPTAALGRLLRSAGVADAAQPDDVAERAARFRTAVDGRRILLLLDNAQNSDQVRMLVPGSASCVTVVTSRSGMGALRDRYGARQLELDVMTVDEGGQLLQALQERDVKPDRHLEQPDVLHAVSALCAGLPLALRIAAGLAADGGGGLGAVVEGLSDRRRRLDLLDSRDDPRTAVRSVLSWSVAQLDELVAGTFRQLGLHPGPDIGVASVAALCGISVLDADRRLQTLVRVRLLQRRNEDRLFLHDLLRDYARERAELEDSHAERDAALDRLEIYYLRGALDAMTTIEPAAGNPATGDPHDAMAWLDQERAGILDMFAVAGHRQHWEWVCRAADALWRYLHIRGLYADAVEVHARAVDSGERLGDPGRTGRALEHLGIAQQLLGRYADSLRSLQRAVHLHECGDDRVAEARAIGYIGTVHARLGNHETAISWMRRSLAIAEVLDDVSVQYIALNNMGLTHQRWGRYEPALEYLDRALSLARQRGNAREQAMVLNNRGLVLRRVARIPEAYDSIRAALEIAESIGDHSITGETLDNLGALLLSDDRPDEALKALGRALDTHRAALARAAEAETLDNIGMALARTGRPDLALDHHQQALDLARTIGDRDRMVSAHLGCGRSLTDIDTAAAEDHLTAALHLAEEVDNPDQRARSLDALGDLHQRRGSPDAARPLWREAIRLYDLSHLPEADILRRRLADIDPDLH